MASRGCTGHSVIWTLHLSGGEPFEGLINLPGVMPVRISHTGGVTLCSLQLSKQEAATLGQFLLLKGIQVKLEAQEVTPEQQGERSHLGDESQVFLTPKCPSCFWLDITSMVSPCGVEGWTQEMFDESIDTYEKAVTDLEECPLRARPNRP